jgi:hypothetical protein
MISVTVIGTRPQQLIDITHSVYLKTKKGLEETAHETRKYMVEIIEKGYQGQGKRDGSANILEDSILVEKLDEDAFGVGNIMNMNHIAPYWGLLNSGGMVSLKARIVPGYFGNNNPPDSAFAGTGGGKEKLTYDDVIRIYMMPPPCNSKFYLITDLIIKYQS